MASGTKRRIWGALEVSVKNDRLSRLVDLFLMALIILNVVAVVLETVESVKTRHEAFLHGFDLVSIWIFSAEYVLRIWSCTADPRYASSIRGRVRYILTPMALVDLLAVLPFYMPVLLHCDLRMVRALRLFRLFRLLKLTRYASCLRTFGRVLSEKKEPLLLSCLIMGLMVIFSSSLLYFVEHGVQPDHFSSIPMAMWWSVSTLTTVGYGDIYPITPLGKVCAGIISVLGIGMFAMPAGILASGFSQESRSTRELRCPHCGRGYNDPHGVHAAGDAGQEAARSPDLALER